MSKTSTIFGIVLKTIILLIILIYFNICQAQNQNNKKTDSTEVEINYNDGPHIYWKNDTTAIVFYMCDNTIDSQTIYSSDTIYFEGFCNDSVLDYVIPVGKHKAEPYIYSNVPKIFVLSDIHGEYEYFVDILIKSGLIDKNLNWIWGDGHLVIDGDVFDRGDMVTECLWLIYRLEIQADQQGGKVHFLLGNHELMILRSDNRYINEKYLKGIVKKSRIDHADLYGPDMELGRWLRTKPTAIMINNILFVHAGISPAILERRLDIKWLNETAWSKIDLRSSQLAFDSTAKFLFGSKGPFWYRGYFYEMENRYPQITQAQVDSSLDYFGATAIVVGHTGVAQVTGLYGNRIYAIDIPFEDIYELEGLFWKNDNFYRVTGDGTQHPIELKSLDD